MANWQAGALTKAGRNLLAKVESGSVGLNITRLKIGDGNETAEEADNLIDLKSPKVNLSISSRIAADGICTISGVVLSSQIATGFYAREMGIFANDPDIGEILYMIALDDNPDVVSPRSTAVLTSVEYAMGIVVANVSELQIKIDPQGLITRSILEDALGIVKRATAYKVGTVVRDTSLPAGYRLKCITAGVTSENDIIYTDEKKLNKEFKDGTVTWLCCREVTTNGDIFRRIGDTETNSIKMNGKLDHSDGVEFVENINGSITPAPKRFVSNAWKQNGSHFTVMPLNDDDSDDSDITDTIRTATESEIDSLTDDWDF